MPERPILLDGPMGTALEHRGLVLEAPLWTADAVARWPERVAALHAAYAAAGAEVHTAATFRTTARHAGTAWRGLVRDAVGLARGAVPAGHRVAGSVAPLEDCYRPDLSPPSSEAEHRRLTEALAEEGVDLILCETFPHVEEALAAVRAAVATGVPTWLALSAGYRGDLLTPAALGEGARRAVDLGARAVLVNCTPAVGVIPFLEALQDLQAPFGVYANAGRPRDGLGEGTPGAAERWVSLAEQWFERGSSIIGGCCGTGPEHVAALSRRWVTPAFDAPVDTWNRVV